MVFWYNELHPLLNKGKWAKDEDKLLLKLTEENSGGNWEKIACELKVNYCDESYFKLQGPVVAWKPV
jgi:hypothetical protein